ncbi:MAG TPA: hypothetical protein VFG53_13345 [Anaeromyxobacter sp.]|nr:hypothetical protein [Anaeromyxobacter sp.]
MTGTKRTGLLAAIVFLNLNGVEIADPEGKLYDALTGLADPTIDKLTPAALLAELVRSRSLG